MPASRPSLASVARFVFACATLAALAWFAFQLVSIAFRLVPRPGVRSAAAVALPLLGGTYGLVSGRHSLRRIRALPPAARFAIGLAAGALALGSVPWFLPLLPVPDSHLYGFMLQRIRLAMQTVLRVNFDLETHDKTPTPHRRMPNTPPPMAAKCRFGALPARSPSTRSTTLRDFR